MSYHVQITNPPNRPIHQKWAGKFFFDRSVGVILDELIKEELGR
jgi:hypothetical protein